MLYLCWVLIHTIICYSCPWSSDQCALAVASRRVIPRLSWARGYRGPFMRGFPTARVTLDLPHLIQWTNYSHCTLSGVSEACTHVSRTKLVKACFFGHLLKAIHLHASMKCNRISIRYDTWRWSVTAQLCIKWSVSIQWTWTTGWQWSWLTHVHWLSPLHHFASVQASTYSR